jgi:small-conductance mechanosensitive channel
MSGFFIRPGPEDGSMFSRRIDRLKYYYNLGAVFFIPFSINNLRTLLNWRPILPIFLIGLILSCSGFHPAQAQEKGSSAARMQEQVNWAGLEKILADTVKEQENNNVELEKQIGQEKEALRAVKKSTEEGGTKISALKAAMALGKLELIKSEEILKQCKVKKENISGNLKRLGEELTILQQRQVETKQARTDIQSQVGQLKQSSLPETVRNHLEKLSAEYNKATKRGDNLQVQLINLRKERQQELEKHDEILQEIITSLQGYIDKTAKVQILQRQWKDNAWVMARRFIKETQELPDIFRKWQTDLRQSERINIFFKTNLVPLVGLLACLALLLYGTRRIRKPLELFNERIAAPATNFTQKALLAILQTVSRNLLLVTLTLWVGVSLRALDLFDYNVAWICFYSWLGWSALRITNQLVNSLFDPINPEVGIIPLDQATARFYGRQGKMFMDYLIIAQWFISCLELLGYSADLIYFTGFLMLVGMLIFLSWLLRNHYLENLLVGLRIQPDAWQGQAIKILRLGVVLFLIGIIISQFLGFYYLSLYLAQSTVNSTLIAILCGVGACMANDLIRYLVNPQEGYLAHRSVFKTLTLERTHDYLPGVIDVLLGGVAIFGILKVWGVDSSFYYNVYNFLSFPELIDFLDAIGMDLEGNRRISLWVIIKAGVLLALLLTLSVKLCNFIKFKVEQKSTLSPTVKVLMIKLLKTTLYTLSTLFALNSVGIDYHLLTVFSGAVGLGLGFGLQKVVSNLVSGVIILMDRSIRPGDVIEVGDTYGWIEALHARYVSVVTNEGRSILIPNDNLVSNNVINWSFSGPGVKLKIPLGISYNSDVDKAMELMVATAHEFPRVLPNPAPVAHLIGFGDNSINLELHLWIKDPEKGFVDIKSGIQHRLWKVFRHHGIEFPFPQREVHLKELSIRVNGQREEGSDH